MENLASLAFDKTDDGRMKIEDNGLTLNDSGWTLTAWCVKISFLNLKLEIHTIPRTG